MVIAAGRGPSPRSREALETLCGAYWYPLYAYVRRQGYSRDDARDLAQEFFATLLEKNYVEGADPNRGRFRAYLLTAFQRFLIKQNERARALKRGGGRKHLSLDFSTGESRYALEPADVTTPERLYERRWALTLLDHVLARLAEEYARLGKAGLFEALKPLLAGTAGQPSHLEIAKKLGSTEGAVKSAVHRLRRRYRQMLREEISQTVSSEEEIADELNHLMSVVGA